jgi:hypothetical protein
VHGGVNASVIVSRNGGSTRVGCGDDGSLVSGAPGRRQECPAREFPCVGTGSGVAEQLDLRGVAADCRNSGSVAAPVARQWTHTGPPTSEHILTPPSRSAPVSPNTVLDRRPPTGKAGACRAYSRLASARDLPRLRLATGCVTRQTPLIAQWEVRPGRLSGRRRISRDSGAVVSHRRRGRETCRRSTL